MEALSKAMGTTDNNCGQELTDPNQVDEITRDMGRTDDNRSLPEDYAGDEQEREFIQRLTAVVWEWLKQEVQNEEKQV